jgi:hypothetical protein
MSPGEIGDDQLREAFALSDSLRGPREACPSPERLWESAREDLGAGENEIVVRHLATCAACAAAWRVARDLAGGDAAAAAPVIARRRAGWREWMPLAAAAMLIVVAGIALQYVDLRPTSPPAYRAEEALSIRPSSESLRPMPRDRFLLRWSAGPAGTSYDVRVIARGRPPLARGVRLTQPEFQVPAAAFDSIPARTKILWQVTAYLPDGRVSDSATFIAELE